MKRVYRVCLGLTVTAMLAACAVAERTPAPLLYDFGPGVVVVTAPQEAPAAQGLALRVQSGPALETSAMLYRLAYANDRQLRAYTLARWSMPPTELVQQRLREGLGRHFAVLRPGEIGAARLLQIDLEEFSQIYESTSLSKGVLKMRVTLWENGPQGARLLGQRLLLLQKEAQSPDALGGVLALSLAADEAIDALRPWLMQQR